MMSQNPMDLGFVGSLIVTKNPVLYKIATKNRGCIRNRTILLEA
jgi:hypothetical protein